VTIVEPWAGDNDALADEARSVLDGEIERVDDLPHATRTTATSRVVRVRTGDRSAVAKFISSGHDDPTWGGSRHPAHLRYWRREPDFYRVGVPAPFAEASIGAPALLGRFDRPGGIVLWLEDVGGTSGGRLGVGALASASRRLGRAQAPYALGRAPVPALPLSTDALFSQLRSWEDVGWDAVDDDEMWGQPLVERHFPPRLRQSLVRFGERRWEVLEISRRLPQTICHHDVWLNNLFALGDRTVLVDWAFVGHGHLGCDAGNIVTDACGDLLLPASLLPELDAAVTVAYTRGLADAGWTGDRRAVRLGICLMAAKWAWLVPHTLRRAALGTHMVYGGGPAEADHLYAERAAMLGYLSAMADEASALARELGL
jgi:hypothetical protein